MAEKLIFFVGRAPSLSVDEFRRRYIESHAPLALEHWKSPRRYAVNLVEEPDEDYGDGLRFDAMAEMHFASLEDFTDRARLYDASDAPPVVEQDAATLFGSALIYRVSGVVQRGYQRSWALGGRSPGNKIVAPLYRGEGLTHEQFVEHWHNVHAPLALEHVLGIGRYVTNEVIASLTPDAPAIDGIVEVHYTDRRRMATPDSARIMAEDVQSFLVQPKRHPVREYVFRE